MNRVSSGCLATIIFCACSLMPCAAELSVSLVSISPSVSDVTDQIPGSPPPGNTQFAYLAGSNPFGTSYTAVYSVSEEPGAVTGIGADISQTTYDSSAGQITINFTSAEIQSDLNFVPGVDLSTLFAIAFSEVSTSGDGPPAEFRGGYLATNVFEWMLIPPSPDNIRFGIELTGREGDTGFFRMFIPDTLIDLLSQLSGETLDAEDLAVFDNDQQASLAVSTATNGSISGALVDVNVLFESTAADLAVRSAASTTSRRRIRAKASGDTVTKSLTTRVAADSSIILRNSVIAKRDRAFSYVSKRLPTTSRITYTKAKTRNSRKVKLGSARLDNAREVEKRLNPHKGGRCKKCRIIAKEKGAPAVRFKVRVRGK